jgi:hypothetical protein
MPAKLAKRSLVRIFAQLVIDEQIRIHKKKQKISVLYINAILKTCISSALVILCR